jgi:intracellular sulfur oxidation DsrE/DsrF family protein
MNQIVKAFLVLVMGAMLAFSAMVNADSHTKNKLVIQVSTDDPRTQKIALNNAVNLQKLYGIDNIDIEIVAYGPGLGLLTTKSSQAERVTSLAMQDITFSACGNTMEKVAEKTGNMPKLLEGVGQVTAGVARIMELQQQGYAYIRP